MADFSNLQRLKITEATEAEYVFEDIVIGLREDGREICPSIWFAPALEQNKAYHNERHRLAHEAAEARKNETREQRKARLTGIGMAEEEREYQRVLIARTCARRWGTGMPDVNGEVPEFNEQNVYDFLKWLDIHVFDALVGWIGNQYNFFDRRALITEEQAETLGNSSPRDSSGS